MSVTFCDPKVIVALDFDNQNAANELISKLDPNACRLKIGKEMFYNTAGINLDSRKELFLFRLYLT